MRLTKNSSMLKDGLKKILKPYCDRLLRASFSVYASEKMDKDIEWYPDPDGSDYVRFCEKVQNTLNDGKEYYSIEEKKGSEK